MEKYNLKELLLKADKELTGSNSLVGKTMLTIPTYNNSMRSYMNTSHLNQCLDVENPDFPGLFTNGENVVGKHSSGYKKAENDTEIYKKVVKFGDIVDKPTVYILFVYDRKKKVYDIWERKEAENLVEVFGYSYNNEAIDSIEEGDIVEAGTVVYKAKAYDEFMNYGYGKNVPMMYTNDPRTAEDACLCAESLAEMLGSPEINSVPIGINHNDFLLNLYGDEDNYKPLPEIGEYANGVVAVKRSLNTDQLLIDFKSSSLNTVLDSDTKYYKTGKVIDMDIYCNNPDIEETPFNSKILEYLESQNRYYEEIRDTCEEIFRTGRKVTHNLDYLYKRACEFLNPDKKWKINDSVFSNLYIEITVKKIEMAQIGQKLTGRSGNKSVISKIVPDEEMPYYYDENGKKVTILLLFNLLGVINRTTGLPLFELSINFLSNKVSAHMQNLPTRAAKEKLLFEYIHDLNEDQAREMYKVYSNLTDSEKDEYIQDCIDDRIYIRQKPMWETKPIFHRLLDIYEKYDFFQPHTLYIRKWGREIEVLNKCAVGEMYIMKLKQTSRKGFSVRGMGSINAKGLPERSYKNKVFTERTSSTPIRFGEFETLNFMIAMLPEDIQLFHLQYRTSSKARKELGERLLTTSVDDNEEFEISKSYTNRVAEIFSVILKSLGLELKFIDEDEEVVEYDDEHIKAHSLDGVDYICTDWRFMIVKRIVEIKKEILSQYCVIDGDELKRLIKEKISETKFLLGPEKEELEEILEYAY